MGRSSIGVDLHKLVINGVDLHELVINGVDLHELVINGVDLHELVINGVDLHELVINGVLMERDLSYQHIVNIFQYVKVYRLVNGTAYYS